MGLRNGYQTYLRFLTIQVIFSGCHGIMNENLTIVTVLAYDSVQHQIPWHIRGFLLGYSQLHEEFRDRINIRHEFLWQRNVSKCADVAARVVTWASKVYYSDSRRAVMFASPGCFQEILELGAITREWNALFITTLGNNFLITPRTYPTIVSMSYRPQSSFDGFFIGVCEAFAWKTSVWLCDQDQTVSAFPSGRCSSAQEMLQKQRSFVSYFIHFRSSDFNARELLAYVRPLARIIILSALPDTVRTFMMSAHEGNMTSGEYVFITVQELPDAFQNFKLSNNTKAQALKEALRVLFVMTIKVPYNQSALDAFNRRAAVIEKDACIQKLLRDQDVARSDLQDKTKLYNIVDYEALRALSTVLDDALLQNVSLKDGTSLARLFYNRTFYSAHSDFYVDSYGRRLTPMVLKDFNTSSNSFEDAILGDIVMSGYKIRIDSDIDWGPLQSGAPLDEPRCGLLNNRKTCQPTDNVTVIAAAVVASVIVSLILIAFATFCCVRRSLGNVQWWLLDGSNLVLYENFSASFSESRTKQSHMSVAQYSGTRVHLYRTESSVPVNSLRTPSARSLLTYMKEMENCSSINRFLGICRMDAEHIAFVSVYCDKHSLLTVFTQQMFEIDSLMQVSFIWDLLQGVEAIHSSLIVYHGSLSVTTCCVDRYFTLKICKLGYDRLKHEFTISENAAVVRKNRKRHSRWEIRSDEHMLAQQKADIFHAGIILAQILGQPNWASKVDLNPVPEKGVVQQETMDSRYPLQVLVQSCLEQESRPEIRTLINRYTKIVGARPKQMAEVILQRLSRYNDALEAAVRERIIDLRRQQMAADEVLAQLLSQTIVRHLRAGLAVLPEYYDSASVCFTSFDGFMEFVQQSPPTHLVEFLNQMVQMFEKTIMQYDVYRVEVVADAHMIASGVPLRNDDAHAGEVCEVARQILQLYRKDDLLKHEWLQLRAGAHTGPVMSAIVGTKLPKYSLVGDTINCASRMTSSGRGTCLQVSEETKRLLCNSSKYHFSFFARGPVEIKGKGMMSTFWVT